MGRYFSSGMEMTLRNILGYAFGPLLPGVVMEFIGSFMTTSQAHIVNDSQLCCGLAFVFAGNFLDCWILTEAHSGARLHLEDEQARAFEQLQEAFRTDDIVSLERAVHFARQVDLHHRQDGEAVIGMANETIGAHHAGIVRGEGDLQRSAALLAKPEELRQRIQSLERELAELRSENEVLHQARALCEAEHIPILNEVNIQPKCRFSL